MQKKTRGSAANHAPPRPFHFVIFVLKMIFLSHNCFRSPQTSPSYVVFGEVLSLPFTTYIFIELFQQTIKFAGSALQSGYALLDGLDIIRRLCSAIVKPL